MAELMAEMRVGDSAAKTAGSMVELKAEMTVDRSVA